VNLAEWFDFISFTRSDLCGMEKEMHGRQHRLYRDLLAELLGIERRAYAAALAGTYDGAIADPAGRRAPAKLSLDCFQPKLADPGPATRWFLLAPKEVTASYMDLMLRAKGAVAA